MKFFKRIHLILGLIFGIFFIILCATGIIIAISELFRDGHSDIWSYIIRYAVSFHRWLFLPNIKLGRSIIGITTVCMIITFISGVIIFLPKKIKYWKSMFRISFKKGYVLHTIHKVLGVYATLWLLMLALTGIMWSYPRFADKVSSVLNIQHIPTSIRYREIKNTKTGEIKTIDLEKKLNSRQKMMVWVGMLHVGKWGYGTGVFLNIIACLIGLSLPISGFITYIKRKQKRRVRK